MRVLLLEDEKMLQDAIAEYLGSVGYVVDTCDDGSEAYATILQSRYDLFIFDINTPNIDGLSLLAKLQKEKIFAPTIFISAITQIEQITQAYELGCYDYLKKPFHLKELLLHIQRLMKKGDICAKHLINISPMYIYDTDNKRLLFDSQEQLLTPKQGQIIHLLAVNANKIIDFERLRYEVWNSAEIDNATIRAEMHRVRAILKEDIIQTIKGIGYRLKTT